MSQNKANKGLDNTKFVLNLKRDPTVQTFTLVSTSVDAQIAKIAAQANKRQNKMNDKLDKKLAKSGANEHSHMSGAELLGPGASPRGGGSRQGSDLDMNEMPPERQ